MIAQQDFIRIKARVSDNAQDLIVEARALVELQRLQDRPESILAVLLEGIYPEGAGWETEPSHFFTCFAYNMKNKEATFGYNHIRLGYMGSIENCETLAILEEASQTWPVALRSNTDTGYLYFYNIGHTYVAVDGKYVSVTLDQATEVITALEVTDVEIPEGTDFVNITEADLMKLIGTPRINPIKP